MIMNDQNQENLLSKLYTSRRKDIFHIENREQRLQSMKTKKEEWIGIYRLIPKINI
jgi:hypothetical protein